MAHRKGKSPSRLHCMVCTDGEGELLALAHTGTHGFVADPRGRLSRSPLLVHFRATCLDGARARADAIASEIDLSPEDTRRDLENLRDAVREQIIGRARQCLAQCAAAGIVVGGHDALLRALEADEVAVVIAASDAAPRTLRSLSRGTTDALLQCQLGLDRDTLGARVGQPPRAAVGVPRCSASAPLLRELERLLSIDAGATTVGLG